MDGSPLLGLRFRVKVDLVRWGEVIIGELIRRVIDSRDRMAEQRLRPQLVQIDHGLMSGGCSYRSPARPDADIVLSIDDFRDAECPFPRFPPLPRLAASRSAVAGAARACRMSRTCCIRGLMIPCSRYARLSLGNSLGSGVRASSRCCSGVTTVAAHPVVRGAPALPARRVRDAR